MLAAVATLHDLTTLGPTERAWAHALVEREQLAPLPLFGASRPGDLLSGQPLSRSLSATLTRIADVSDSHGFRLLCDALATEGIAAPPGVGPRGLALWTALNEPAAFNRAVELRRAVRQCRMRTFSGAASKPMRIIASDGERSLAPRFGALGRTDHCQVLFTQDRSGLHFLVDHGSNLRCVHTVTQGSDGSTVGTLRLRPRRRDYVHFDVRAGVLSVGAWDAATLGIYRETFGQLLFDDPDWFGSGDLLTLEPLRDLGRRALLPTANVTAVTLVRLTLRAPGPLGTRLSIDSPDVFESLEADEASRLLQEGELLGARLRVRVPGYARARSVDLTVPNRIAYDWRKGGEHVRDFLIRRGFLAAGAP